MKIKSNSRSGNRQAAGVRDDSHDKAILHILQAVKKGDFSVRLPAEWTGLVGKIADEINGLIDLNAMFAEEFKRVSHAVGKKGKLFERASVPEARGEWKTNIEAVNGLIEDLVRPTTEMARVIGAVAKGDLTQSVALEAEGHPLRGEFLSTAKTVNSMVGQLDAFAAEVTRVAREVGTEGKLGGQAVVPGVAGTWKDLTDNVNSMASNLTNQVRNIAEVTIAVANGDLSKKITADVRGEILQLKDTINTMVDQLRSFAAEVTRVAREVGTDGKLGGQAVVPGVAGTWKDLTDSVNSMASNLTNQVRNIAEVTVAVANGDLSKKITVDVRGEILQLKDTINTMVDQLRSFAAEVTRVAREVGTDGKLGGQAQVRDVSGVWKDLTESVNLMAGNLTAQVRNIAEVTTAVANGDLSKKITADVRGEILQLKEAINTMVDQLRSFAAEVTRVALEVGTEGKLGGQAQVRDVSGVWKDLTESVNLMAGNLTDQVRNIAEVTIAVANGDLSKKITVDVRGEILQLKEAINTMVDQLRSFAAEVTRVAREVGTEGKLGGQAAVSGVAGTWKDLTDSVNSMASNLTDQVRNIAYVTIAVANGDLSKKITADVRGEILQLKEAINTMVDQLRSFAAEVTRVAREVGTEGKLGGQAQVRDVSGVWKDLTDSVNLMAGNLTDQVRNIANVTIAVANGDLSKKITVDVHGEILQLKEAINTMVDQLRSFAAEVTRVAREVGTEGKLGGQAVVPGVAGTWKDLTDSVNAMASNLTVQLRDMSNVATSIANGDLTRQITVDVRGEILQIKDVINRMVAQLSAFASEVTRVAREVGTEGKLGGQAIVPGVPGTWKDLTESVNLLAANLTTQVRAIAEVATAVTQGNLTRSIQVQARGEVAELKDNINVMIRTLRATTEQNTEQDWLKTNLAKFTRMMQGQRDLTTVGDLLLTELAPLVNAQYGAIYQHDAGEKPLLRLLASYAGENEAIVPDEMRIGVGLVAQCAREKRRIVLTDVPPDYIRIRSGLGETQARNVIVLPVLFEGRTKAVIELATLSEFTPTHMAFLGQLTETIGVVVNTIEATMQTEGLLQQSQNLATELQAQQKELQQTNEELAKKAQQLAEQNAEVERKNREIEQARHALEDKARELALASKYKSEFLANMSHELRTPLNSILILAQQLGENPDRNLNAKQVEFSKNIHAAGADLLNLISDILDLSKIESGTVTVEPEEVLFMKVREATERSFRHVAEARQLAFHIEIDPQLPRSLMTDFKRLQQVLKNLLSNAFKFTSHGQVTFRIRRALAGWNLDHPVLSTVPTVVAFEVSDTGIGIPVEKQKIVFEAFQQADAGTSRRFGGTGLGLAISRELAMLLGGEIRLVSAPREGSTFTLYLPETYMGAAPEMILPKFQLQQQTPLLVQQAHHLEDIPDDRETIMPGEPTVLIVEDDPHYARVLLGAVREKGLKGIVTAHGRLALSLTREYKPVAITLDIFLPDMLGWTVLSHLKQDPETRHIPVQILTVEEERLHGLGHGAFAYMIKPTTTEDLGDTFGRLVDFTRPRHKRLLLVEDNEIERRSLCELLTHDEVDIVPADNGARAWDLLSRQHFDCVVLDLRLPDMSGFQILERIREHEGLRNLPVIVSTGKDLSEEEEIQLRELSQGIVLKGVQSPERLLDEATLFLHLVVTQLSPEKQRMLERVRQSDDALVGKKVLVVDDDIRNIFALTSLLERHGMEVTSCETGREAVQKVEDDEDLDMVLMDIMMPEMDGYETMRQIRQNPRHRLLPILALTAKAMKGDRERCLQAGASDYIAKPVNTDELLALLRIWLYGRKKAMRRR